MEGSIGHDEPVWVPMVSAPSAFSTSPKRKISLISLRGIPRNGARQELDFEDENSDDYESDTLCGVGSWRPAWLQKFANLGMFTFVLSVINLLNGIFNTYFNAVITSIENRFGLSSSMMGFLKNVDNIGYLCSIFIIAHFCRYANKPKLFTFACVMSALATILFAFPHFIYGAGTDIDLRKLAAKSNRSISTQIARSKESLSYFCDTADKASTLLEAKCNQGTSNTLGTFNAGALAFFILSQLIQGVSNSPSFALSITYMDDNAKKDSTLYLGILFSMRSLSPLLGYILGAWTMSMYVDLSETDLKPRDPTWVGAWWIGFVLLAVIMLLWAVPTILFPERLPGQPSQRHEKKNYKEMAKDLPSALARLVRNPVYVCLACGLAVDIFTMGFYTFLPKYIQIYFGLTPSIASIVSGGIGVFGWAIGPIVCGKVMSVVKVTVKRSLIVLVIIAILSNVGFLIQMLISCPEPKYGGIGLENSVECTSNCTCSPQIYQPVCDGDLTYVNPCVVGCSSTDYTPKPNVSEAKFEDCYCSKGSMDALLTQGACPRGCGVLVLYIIIAFLTTLVTSTFVVPALNLGMRCVESRDKALSLAISSSVISIFVFPSPLAFGALIDSACVLFDSKCGVDGRCKLYDHSTFRMRLHGGVVIIKIIATLFYAAGWYFSTKYADMYETIERQNMAEKEGLKDNEENEIKEHQINNSL